MKKITDDEIMAKALLCPESEKVPLEVGDRVIALEDFTFWMYGEGVKKGSQGLVVNADFSMRPWRVDWGFEGAWWIDQKAPIGKLVKRGSV